MSELIRHFVSLASTFVVFLWAAALGDMFESPPPMALIPLNLEISKATTDDHLWKLITATDDDDDCLIDAVNDRVDG